jgi:hypothetical protein
MKNTLELACIDLPYINKEIGAEYVDMLLETYLDVSVASSW